MALLYLVVMCLLQIAGYDMVSGDDVGLQALLGVIFASIAGVLKIWREISR